ncbi:MAG: tRNA pseudouridine(38-40) synthase TruA, partial [Lachnospiraceae bacterium]|nr:tRNA pseudouridine(38-40) synthase TruA [Lachnospiraceae bacterium]
MNEESNKKRILLRVAYDGTDFHGWQVQPNARSVEGELNKAIQEITGEEISVIGASRTDAGVHGMCNVAVFDTASPIPADKFMY